MNQYAVEPLTEAVINTLREAAHLLTGHKRRQFQAQVALDYLDGSPRRAERVFGWGRSTVELGLHELRTGIICLDAFSARGRGKRVEVKQPAIVARLEQLLANDIAGDPMSEEKWVRSSLTHLSGKLQEMGYSVSRGTVRRLLRDMGFSRKSNKRKQPKPKCPTRNEQFEYIALQRQCFATAGLPIISVDTKKKELIGPFRNPGQCWCREADEVDEHDFPSAAECQAIPFGIYDVTKNRGSVVVGISNNTPEFAVNSIARWWETEGRSNYPMAGQLLILADCGGGNGSRSKAWKLNLQVKLCDRFGLTVTVCHYPPGCSKWNPIEHRLFSYISTNWAGKPLRSLGIMLGYIRGTTTRTGLTVKVSLDEATYRKGQKVTREDMEQLNRKHHSVCPGWNYTISPSSQ
jgi:transposase